MPPFSVGSLLQPFDQQSPVNLTAMIAQMGLQNPEALAGLLAARGAQPPAGVPAAGAPTTADAVSAAQKALASTQTVAPSGVPPTPLPPNPTPQPVPQPPIEKAQGGLEGALEALSKLKTPPLPEVIRPPSPIAPGTAGGQLNPQVIAQLMRLLQGGQSPAIPTLGQLIAGGGGATAAPTLSL